MLFDEILLVACGETLGTVSCLVPRISILLPITVQICHKGMQSFIAFTSCVQSASAFSIDKESGVDLLFLLPARVFPLTVLYIVCLFAWHLSFSVSIF